MNREELIKILHATETPDKIAKWLRKQYFPEIMNRYNSEASRKRFGLYRNEQIPSNERNLTDVRTRMGVLIEFELARISNEILPELGIDDVFWSYVVANRFPDLEIRENNGNRLLRLEIKCLQCVAEEKSANFEVLLIDEPEVSLHPQLQSYLLREMKNVVKKYNKTIIISTHSAEMIELNKASDLCNYIFLEKIRYLNKFRQMPQS